MKSSSRTQRGLIGLFAINGALLGALAWVTFASMAPAQGGFRARGHYLAVSGTIPGSQAAAIYVVDDVNEQLLVIGYDPNTKTLKGLGARDLAIDMSRFGRGRN